MYKDKDEEQNIKEIQILENRIKTVNWQPVNITSGGEQERGNNQKECKRCFKIYER
jgi:hypothetical protein